MEKTNRFLWFLALILSTLACATLTGGPTAPPVAQPNLVRPSNGLIAFLGTDGNVFTVDETGANLLALTNDAHPRVPGGPVRVYQHPTWTRDGQHLAYVFLELAGGEQTARILVTGPNTAQTTEIFNSADEAPFYLYWSPDNNTLSFLTQSTAADLSLRLAFLDGTASRVADTGQPYYWVWSPAGDEIFVHKGGAQATNPHARLAHFFSVDGKTQTFELEPGRFQAPGWSPDGTQFLAATGDALIVFDRAGHIVQTIAAYDLSISATWSPDGQQIAYLPTNSAGGGFLGTLTVQTATGNIYTPSDPTVFAYFWAPDSQKIAYFTFSNGTDADAATLISTHPQQMPRLSLNVMDTTTGATHRLITFQPTEDFLGILPFFDQYHHSATIWAPDSTALVYTAPNADGIPGVWVIPAAGGPPTQIANGTEAFWSWK
ncbi:MAG: PD40 domain-containing protein [Anaerolineales bacterium]|nr:PD40 domain-containing protein [Anaerolineales bacterium]